MNQFSDLPPVHNEFITTSVEKLKEDIRILGVGAGGSFVLGRMDEFSDLDLVMYVDPEYYQDVLNERKKIAKNIGPLLESFTGEHVGEPRLLVCLFGPPLLHVDLKFVSLNDIADKVEDPIILWERQNIVSDRQNKTESEFPGPDPDWIEHRFWIWIHYLAQKIGRGELFEVIDGLSFIRGNVLGPMILQQAGARPQGVRRIEQYGFDYTENLKRTVPLYNESSCLSSLDETIKLYCELRGKIRQDKKYSLPSKVEDEALQYLEEIKHRIETK